MQLVCRTRPPYRLQKIDSDITMTDTEASLGQRLRAYRKQQNLTLAKMAEMTGISVATLSKIENGKVATNFNSVLKISEGLGHPISALIGPASATGPSGRRSISRKGETHLFSSDRWDMETLCDDMLNKRNVFWRARFKCRSLEEYGDFSTHPGEEFLYILEGTLDLYTDTYKPVRLNAGDSIHFDSMTPHAYIAISDPPPVALMSNTVAGQLAGYEPLQG